MSRLQTAVLCTIVIFARCMDDEIQFEEILSVTYTLIELNNDNFDNDEFRDDSLNFFQNYSCIFSVFVKSGT